MDNIDIKIQDKIINIRDYLEKQEKRSKAVESDLDDIEAIIDSLLNYAFAENDNLEELKSYLME